jgi:uncharacterized protein (UPF0210 family)
VLCARHCSLQGTPSDQHWRFSAIAAAAERITAALKSLPIKLCGYSGLMLPVCEDGGLAQAVNEGRISIGSLLHYSGAPAC